MDYSLIEQKMEKAIEFLSEELAAIRAGRANPAILNKLQVEYYGVMTPINQVASVSVPEARQIVVTPWDRSTLSHIEKAIQKGDIGINPMNDGSSIRLIFPELNEQRRKELVKEIKSLGENSKVTIRNIRREAIDQAKLKQKSAELTEDELASAEDKIQKLTNKYVENIDKAISIKEKEILEI